MPPIGKVLGGIDFSALAIDLGGGAAIRYGTFLNASARAFVIVAFVVGRIGIVFIKEPPPAEVKTCPFCMEPNSPGATKCRACTSSI